MQRFYIVLSIMVGVLLIGAVPVWASTLNVDTNDTDCDDGTGTPYCTIQAAIDDASAGDTINVAAGTYNEALDVDVNNLTISGAGPGSTTIDNTGLSSGSDRDSNRQIFVNADNVVLEGFTLEGGNNSDVRYGIKTTGSGVTNQNVTAQNFYRTAIAAVNTSSFTLRNITSQDNDGAGIFLKNVDGVTLDTIGTSGNAWTALAINTDCKYDPCITTDVVFQGSNSFGESATGNGVQLEMENTGSESDLQDITFSLNPEDNADVTLQNSGLTWALHGTQDDDPTKRVRFYESKADAVSAATDEDETNSTTGTNGGPDHFLFDSRYLQDLSDGSLYVADGSGTTGKDTMKIQAAIDDEPDTYGLLANAPTERVIEVDTGTYNENLTIDGPENLTLTSASDPKIKGTGDDNTPAILVTETSGNDSDGLTIKGFTIQNPDGGMGIRVGTADSDDTDIDNVTIEDNVIEKIGTTTSDPKTVIANLVGGIFFRTQDNNTVIRNNVIRDIEDQGTGGSAGIAVTHASTDASIIGNTIDGVTSDRKAKGISLDSVVKSAVIENNTIKNIGDGSTPKAYAMTLTETKAPTPPVGPTDFQITGNTTEAITATGIDNGLEESAALFIGNYPDLGSHGVHFNNFLDGRVDRCCGNATKDGEDMDTLNATNNWWGDPSGPGGDTNAPDYAKDPQEGTLADGSGSPIAPRGPQNSDLANVRFDPWLEGELQGDNTSQTIDGTGSVDADEQIGEGSSVNVTTKSGETTTVIVSGYADNPGTGFRTGEEPTNFYDVHLTNPDAVDRVELKICPAGPETDIQFFVDGSWVSASNQTFDGDNCVDVVITESTTPTIADLGGIPVAGTTPTIDVKFPTLTQWGLMLLTFMLLAAVSWAVARRQSAFDRG